MTTKDKFKGMLYTFIIALYILGTIGGFGYALYCGAYLIGLAVLAVAVLAFPTVKKLWKK